MVGHLTYPNILGRTHPPEFELLVFGKIHSFIKFKVVYLKFDLISIFLYFIRRFLIIIAEGPNKAYFDFPLYGPFKL